MGELICLASFPHFQGAFRSPAYSALVRLFLSTDCPSAQNRWVGGNRGCYENPEMDRISTALLSAVDPAEQRRLWADMVRLYSQELPALPLYHLPQGSVFREGVAGIKGESWREGSSETWNVTEWDVQTERS